MHFKLTNPTEAMKTNRPPMIECLWLTLLAIALAGCGNPADGVEEARVSEPTPPPAAPADSGTSASTSAPELNPAPAQPPVPAGADVKTYAISADSTIGFTGSKITGSHSGFFEKFSGTISVADGTIVSPSSIEIDMDSTTSDSEKLTRHLKSEDFFDVAQFPTSVFSLTGIKATENGHEISGQLTLHGITKNIAFNADIDITESEILLIAKFSIKRFDFDIVYKGRADDLIRDEVVIQLDVKAESS